jgi:glyoxylate/hydroxypyruvate reductase A
VTVVINPFSRHDEWSAELSAVLPDENVVLWPEIGDPGEVEYLAAWMMRRSDMATFTNLKAILSLGAGTEQWQKDGMPDVPVVRLADPEMASEMAAYALHWVLHFQREFVQAAPQQATKTFRQPRYTQSWDYPIGILGYGTIGVRVGAAFADLGYPINAWSRSGGDSENVKQFKGLDELDSFLSASKAVINVLPSTPATTGLLGQSRLAAFAQGSVFVNMGRGTVVDNDVLIEALDSGPLRAAVLDVTSPEPLPDDSPLWGHRNLHLTSHVAGSTQVRSAARLVGANIKRMIDGEEPFPVLDRSRGY